jgi:hypothetical protein
MSPKYIKAKRFFSISVLILNACLFGGTLSADPIEMVVEKNKIEAVITLPGNIETDFVISFDNSLGLTSESIGLTAELVDPTDVNLLNRFPAGLLTSIPAAFPMMVTVEPKADMGLSFEGNAYVDIHTHNLDYTVNTPFRLYKASLGEDFHDITMTTGAGSYRARGVMGGFSQFLIVADLRTTSNAVLDKMQRLDNLYVSNSASIESTFASQITALLNAVRSDITATNYSSAQNNLKDLVKLIKTANGNQIPNVWRSSRDITNVAGELIAQAETLRYSLRIIN